ncbi:M15 family metallopeptidase [Roseivivax isoporae]|uniref:Peptidase M15C domain-containing protein n=1 Tax=Roseivivax isoporae LMG 25204 TaxID=1449351 RepID=X7F8S5_9RHOB|nr:M15 family metallopeptidase [Roseivivax isoporae]ETX29210.1 hypothetical protein RISW2_02020 [Roseivivax isoporae LMG 25204]
MALFLRVLALVLLGAAPLAAKGACTAIDYRALPLPAAPGDPARAALRLAYPDIAFSADGAQLSVGGGAPIPWDDGADLAPAERLERGSVRAQFHDPYPLAFDLAARSVPWNDPGRVRNDTFFRALWGATRDEVRAHLVAVADPPLGAPVTVTTRRNVACQLRAALAEAARAGPGTAEAFRAPGGGFNWRVIAGTDRLSAHSFGIAVDLDPATGPYWRWSGGRQGAAGGYDNRMPQDVVEAMERRGFIWGGKWHHFDAMHFEYRPELILHARLVAGRRP